MMFFKRKNNSNEPKPRSMMGMLLNPDIGASIRPIRETTGVFVNLLALIFASQGMFPRNHPALIGVPGSRLTLPEVLRTAYSTLSFTKEKLPQVLLFCAVIASLFFSVVAVFVMLTSMFIGKAHAQGLAAPAGGYFSPVSPSQDIALAWINYLFNGTPIYNYLTGYGQVVPQSAVIQGALLSALAFYSDAILIVAAAILFYHLASMVVETAHHGVAMGKRANQIWAPIRLVFAIGLLVPVSSGLNSGQFIVITIAEWGSGLASQVWNVFLNQLTADTYQGVAANAPFARKVVYDTVMMEACACAYNFPISGSCSPNGGAATPPPGTVGSPPVGSSLPGLNATIAPQPAQQLSDKSTTTVYDLQNTTPGDAGTCGHYTFPPPPITSDQIQASMLATITSTAQSAYSTMQSAARSFVATNMPYFIDPSYGGTGDQTAPTNSGNFEQIVSDYETALQAPLTASASQFSSQMQQVAQVSSAQGWVSAGAWFNTVARVQSELMDITGLMPGTQGPQITSSTSPIFTKNVQTELTDFQAWLNYEQPLTNGLGAGAPSQRQQLDLAMAGFTQADNKQNHVMDNVFMAVDWIAAMNGVWTTPNNPYGGGPGLTSENFTLGVQFMGANPLAEIAAFGHNNISTAYQLIDEMMKMLADAGLIGIAGSLVGSTGQIAPENPLARLAGIFGVAVGHVTAQVAGTLASIIGIISVIFFTSGFMLAFFLPLIPFFRFLMNTLTWVISLLEAIICVPMICLAHLNPAGEGLPGETGKTAYYFIFNIFLRPVLMVFGLMVGLLLFFIGASAMNMLYMLAVAGAGGISHGHLFLSRMAYSFIYVFVLYTLANNSFRMIIWLPDHALKWMGGQPMTFHQMGDPDSLATPFSGVTGYADQQIVGSLSKMTGATAVLANEALHHRTPDQWAGDIKSLGHDGAEGAANLKKFVKGQGINLSGDGLDDKAPEKPDATDGGGASGGSAALPGPKPGAMGDGSKGPPALPSGNGSKSQ